MQSHKIWCCFFLFFRSAGYKHVLQNIHFLTIHRHMSENSFLKQSGNDGTFLAGVIPKKKKTAPVNTLVMHQSPNNKENIPQPRITRLT